MTHGPTLLASSAVLGAMAGALVLFVRFPEAATTALVAVFLTLPVAKLFITPSIGPLKDLIVVVAAGAAVVVVIQLTSTGQRAIPDAWFVFGLGALGFAYVVNPAGPHDAAWLHGTRLTLESLAMAFVGCVFGFTRARYTVWLLTTLVLAALPVAAYGLLQQVLGHERLVSMGYAYGVEVRTIGAGLLRSFGTLDDPFNYAATLTLAVAVLCLAWERIPLSRSFRIAALVVLLAGVGVALVRTSVVILAAVLALVIAARGRPVVGATILGAVAILGVLAFGMRPQAVETQSFGSQAPGLDLNGRVDVWSAAIPSVKSAPFGRGVGRVGTGQARSLQATGVVNQESREALRERVAGTDVALAVDSSFVAALADTGVVGLGILVGLLVRAARIGITSIGRGAWEGWVVVGSLVVLGLDALTRNNLTAFPGGFLMMLALGAGIGAACSGARDGDAISESPSSSNGNSRPRAIPHWKSSSA